MKKIINPYIETENGNCFGCSPKNEQGLQMEFMEDGEFIIAKWDPKAHFAGFKNVLLTVRARLISQEKKFANIYAEILDENGNICSEAEVQYMVFPTEMAKKKFGYPGIEAFYE